MDSIAEQIGCTQTTLRQWVRHYERDQARGAVVAGDERDRLKALERKIRELRNASAFFVQAELDRHDQ